MTIAAEQGFAFFLAEGAVFRGWALAEQGDAESGIEQMRQGLAALRAGGAEMGRPSHLGLLAEAYARAKRPEDGLAVLDEALATVADTGERSYEAELHRLKGELLRRTSKRIEQKDGMETDAQECFRHALAIARRQAARSLELRAAVGLVRLHRSPRSQAAARRALGEVYASFTGDSRPRI
jgi:predicted ATPase